MTGPKIKEPLMADDLIPTKVYSFDAFTKVLYSHGFPNSEPWIRKMEAKGLIPSPRLPSAVSKKAKKVYTGKQIQKAIKNLLAAIEKK